MKPSNPTTTPPGENRTSATGARPGDRLKQTGKDAAAAAKTEARERVEEGAQSIAAGASDASEALDTMASSLAAEGHETLAQAAFATSDRIANLARYLETHSVDELTREARRLARSNPGLMILGGLALGFALSRFFKASAASSATDLQRSPSMDTGSYAPRRSGDLQGSVRSPTTPHHQA